MPDADHPAPPKELKINPWFTALGWPRATVRLVLAYKPAHRLLLIAGLVGFFSVLESNHGPWSKQHSLELLLGLALGAGVVPAVLLFFVATGALARIAPLMGGVASARETRAACAWATMPYLFAGPLIAVSAVMNAPELSDACKPVLGVVNWLAFGVSTIAKLWSGHLALIMLAHVNRIGRFRVTLAGVLAVVIVIGFVFAVGVACALVFEQWQPAKPD